MIEALAALGELREGNRRFTAGKKRPDESLTPNHRDRLVEGQAPIAAILGCSDARVPAEAVFDQGLGDLFVVRVAGNVAAPSQIGSIEYAVEHLGVRLVVVLGHSRCGAVAATIDDIARTGSPNPDNIRSIVNRVRPAVQDAFAALSQSDPDTVLHEAVRSNIRMAANALRHESWILEDKIRNDGLVVIGAEYALETGEVDFFDGVPVEEERGSR